LASRFGTVAVDGLSRPHWRQPKASLLSLAPCYQRLPRALANARRLAARPIAQRNQNFVVDVQAEFWKSFPKIGCAQLMHEIRWLLMWLASRRRFRAAGAVARITPPPHHAPTDQVVGNARIFFNY
jgi:hypothetical protein